MESIRSIAAYILKHYAELFGEPIDQMKLHKLLYFAQRESFILYDKPLFKGFFHAGKYGPISIEVRDLFRKDELSNIPIPNKSYINEYKDVFNRIWDYYAPKSSLSLSTLSHGEISWKNAFEKRQNSQAPYIRIKNKDIRMDASKIKIRRKHLAKIN